MNRTLSSEISKFIGKKIEMAGWVHARRDHGSLIFIDLRDRDGLTQVVFDSKCPSYEDAQKLRPEWVVKILGIVNKRPEKMENPKIASGKVELSAEKLDILNQAKNLPFEIDKNTIDINENARLKYRYLDLRSERMKKNIQTRSKVIHYLRDYLNDRDFIEIQTPILTKSTPEGARDYIVPSRIHKGKFFALPQSPQQYKQMLMIAGFERYFQIAPCFRDEDARADRSPGEFYQLDMEMSFVTQADILRLVEEMFTKMIADLFPEKKIAQKSWPRLQYQEVIKKYGTDKPDLRKNKKDPDELAFAWVVDFPLFAKQTKEDFFHGAGKVWAPSHHMFTAPKEEDLPLLAKDPGNVKSYQHDLILNGFEVGGGSVRIHDPILQERIFDLIGFSKKQKEQFRHFLRAFEYGTPPHGGIAPGIDRLLAALLGEKNLRETIAFPLNGDVYDPLMDSPSEVSPEQLNELGIKIK